MFHLFVATPESVVFEDKANFLTAPGAAGYFEILPHHAPFISSLKAGKVEFVDPAEKRWSLEITGGLLEVKENHVYLLADSLSN